MPIRLAPPWLKKLGGDASPLKDDAWVTDKLAEMSARAKHEDLYKAGVLFGGPMDTHRPEPVRPNAVADIAASDEGRQAPLLPPAPPDEPMAPAMPAGIDQVTGMPPQIQQGGFLAPPGAPPPPPPADRPPGTFNLFSEHPEEPHGDR